MLPVTENPRDGCLHVIDVTMSWVMHSRVVVMVVVASHRIADVMMGTE